MKSQYINDKPYKDYISLYCHDNLRNELIEALDIIWQHPDGKERIIQSYNIRGKLDVICDDEQDLTAYGAPEDAKAPIDDAKIRQLSHRITINTNKMMFCRDDMEQYFEPSILGTLAHEIYHAADFNVNAPEIVAFQKCCMLIKLQENISDIERFVEIISKFIPENYARLELNEKMKYLEDIYNNENCAALLTQSNSNFLLNLRDNFRSDYRISNYVKKVETPAIDFANVIVEFANSKRDYQEPQRINDYSDSIPLPENEPVTDEKTFKMVVMKFMNEITEAGGEEKYIEILKKACEPKIKKLTAGDLVNIKDTPQASVQMIQPRGTVLSNDQLKDINLA